MSEVQAKTNGATGSNRSRHLGSEVASEAGGEEFKRHSAARQLVGSVSQVHERQGLR
jgi:hypothetical protein